MSDNDTTTRRGRLAEEAAARFLERRKLVVIARNHRCGGGEIDLICRDGGTLVFVEVRLRRNADFGGAAASITPAKQRRIVLAARHYLATMGKRGLDCRFDCVLLDGENIEWIRDAFQRTEV
ncbi:MAG: YraN family protein [Candidatus Accumulibacter sp.]|jgi:putative endonuclease|nr:YraN family protein [Accumulibacter sp.]